MITSTEDLRDALSGSHKTSQVSLGDALIDLALVSRSKLHAAAERARAAPGRSIGEELIAMNLVSREDLKVAIACKIGVPVVDVGRFPTDPEAMRAVSFNTAQRLDVLPLMRLREALVVAMEDVDRPDVIETLIAKAGSPIIPVLARRGNIQAVLKDRYLDAGINAWADTIPWSPDLAPLTPTDTGQLLQTLERESFEADDPTETTISQSDNSLVALINQIIIAASEKQASDIHIECRPGREKIQIRFRKDGVLQPYLELSHTYRNAVVARLKIMCNLDISERRVPQDGKISFGRFSPNHKLDLRVATIPTNGGVEDIVIRLLQSAKPLPLDQINLSGENLALLKTLATRPYGLLLCAGPTGSGKTTAVHAVLAHVNKPENKIWTAEDPVEITHAGLRQVQVNPKIGLTFARALRAFLRADPDIVMVGEIRDEETARMAIEASLTGHLVLSTLHTNSAAETVTRLLDMGMDPFNFGDSLIGVLAQRLVRRLCPKCTTAHAQSQEQVEALLGEYFAGMHEDYVRRERVRTFGTWARKFGRGGQLYLHESTGCEACGHTGYQGRIAIHELMGVTPTLRGLIQQRERSEAIRIAAQAAGMRTLRQDGIEKALLGLVRIEDVRAATNL